MKSLSLLLFLTALASSTESFAQTSSINSLDQINSSCPLMEVGMRSVQGTKDFYTVSYCNHGNELANNAYIELEIQDNLFITKSSLPVTYQLGNVYRFDLGDVAVSDCAEFTLHIPNAGSVMHCTRVHIFPDDPCQAMIDDYITNNAINVVIDSPNSGTTTIDVSAMNSHLYTAMAMAPGQGNTNSILEDNVMLNNLPAWDSLLSTLNGDGHLIRPDDNTTNINNTTTGHNNLYNNDDPNPNASFDITSLVSAERCFKKFDTSGNNGNTNTVFTNAISNNTDLSTVGLNSNDNSFNNNNFGKTGTFFGDDDNSLVTVNVYPNPFRDYTTIQINGATYEEIQVEIMDIAGRTVKVQHATEQQQIMIHRDGLGQGVYIYRLSGNGAVVHTGKIIVQ